MENRAHNAFDAGKALLLAAALCCAPAHAQDLLSDTVDSVEGLLSTLGGGDPDVFGITDLIGTDGNNNDSLSPNNTCEGIQCGESTVFELPGLEERELTDNDGECVDSDRDGICDIRDVCLGSTENSPVLPSGCGLQVGNPIILNDVRFAAGSAQLSDAAKAALAPIVELILTNDAQHIVIEAHTDDDGSEATNEALSEARAKAVYQHLIAKGISEQRLAFVGRGEALPLIPHQTTMGQRLAGVAEINRRIEITLARPDEFAAHRAAMREREQELQRRAARQQQIKQQQQAEQRARQEQAESAEESYNEVLDFLEESGAASREQENTDSENSDPGYTLEVIYPEE